MPGPYTVTLESVIDNGDGTWTWTWSVLNPNPGNGSGGTVQNLSHWAMDIDPCGDEDHVVSADTSIDGEIWGAVTPNWGQDNGMCNGCAPAFNCGVDVFSFNLGTNGGALSWYRLTVDEDYEPAEVAGYYKSGKKTGCGSFTFEGIGCPNDDPEPQCVPDQCDQVVQPYTIADPTITNNGNGTWTWEWSITNNNPGNGKPGTGTFQDMSHFTFPFSACLAECGDESMIVGASYKAYGDAGWTTFTPTFAVDPSMCNTCEMNCNVDVLKFAVGTAGANAALIRVIVNENLSPVTQIGYYKSGKNTGCGCLNFKGLGCPSN